MDPIVTFSLCLLVIPVIALAGWWLYENHDRFPVRTRGPLSRGFDVMPARPRPVLRTGYSFTEVMFAVVILGVGFVMLAAMFPVAIQQTTSTAEETNAAAVARGSVQYLTTFASESTMRPTDNGAVTRPPPMIAFDGIYDKPLTKPPIPPPPATRPVQRWNITPAIAGSWEEIRGSLILATDRRFAFVPFYSRKSGSNMAQITVVVVKCRERGEYDGSDVTPNANANLQPRRVLATITNDGGGAGVDWIKFAAAGTPDARTAVAEGTYVIIGNDPATGLFNGRAYRVGLPATDTAGAPVADTWTLAPGNDYSSITDASGTYDLGTNAEAYIVGREPETPGVGGAYRGIAQDISIYTTFVPVTRE